MILIGSDLELRKIGIYGGTFDPIHHAHLILAREAREQLDLEAIFFVPAATSPFKDAPMASASVRVAMLRAAIADEEGFVIDECEVQRGPPSFSIDTVEAIQKREAEADIYYLLGQDNVLSLPKWHRFEDLRKAVHFVVLDRTGACAPHSYTTVQRKIDISATQIRNRVASRRSIRYLVPEAVEEIIRRENLYLGEKK